VTAEPAFARDAAIADYYEQRAQECDELYLGQGRFSSRDGPGWEDEVSGLVGLVQRLQRCAGRGAAGASSRRRVAAADLQALPGAGQLAAELDGEVLLVGTWFVAVRAVRR
jgi:hypothetical protein